MTPADNRCIEHEARPGVTFSISQAPNTLLEHCNFISDSDERHTMIDLLKSDLIRNFAFGFILGAALLASQTITGVL